MISFILKSEPFSWKAHEGLRLAAASGITNDTNVIFTGDGIYAITKWRPEALELASFEKMLEQMSMLNINFYAENSCIESRGLKAFEFIIEPKIISSEEVKDLIEKSKAVLVW